MKNKNCKGSYLNNLRFKKLSDRLKLETQKLLKKSQDIFLINNTNRIKK